MVSEQVLVCQYRSISGRNEGSKNGRKFEKWPPLSTELTKLDEIFTFCITFDEGLEYLKDSALKLNFGRCPIFCGSISRQDGTIRIEALLF